MTRVSVKEFRLSAQLLCLLVSLVFVPACTSSPTGPLHHPEFSLRNDALFGLPPQIESIDDIHRLSPAQESAFFEFFENRTQRKNPAHERVVDYMRLVLADFEYQDTTFTAQDTLARGQGNCLSLAILTTALAKLARVRVGYQLADSSPVYGLDGGIIVKGVHIRTVLYDKGWQHGENRLGLRAGSVRIDYFPSGSERFLSSISDQQYAARYYRNLAARALAQQNYARAYWLTVESMQNEPLSSDALNTLAVIYRRAGQPDMAEAIYQYGIANLADKLSMLKNYRYLLFQENRDSEVSGLSAQIEALDDPSPFYLYRAAHNFYNNRNYREAIRMYKKAIALAPYLHEARLGLSLSYYQLGDKRMAEKELHAAIERVHVPETRSLYQAKLLALGGQQNNKTQEAQHE